MSAAFYKIIKKSETESSINYEVELNAEHPVYQGHFPDIAVAPGVMLTDMVRTLAENHLGKKLKLVEGKNIKFLQPVLPKEQTIFNLSLNISEENGVAVKSVCSNEKGTYFKVSAIYDCK